MVYYTQFMFLTAHPNKEWFQLVGKQLVPHSQPLALAVLPPKAQDGGLNGSQEEPPPPQCSNPPQPPNP